MSSFDAVILGLIQGFTEFLPISSSGHLILAREIFHIQGENALAFDAILQLATALAVFVYFSRDIFINLRDKVALKAIIFGTIPAVILGFLLEEKMETVFRSTHVVAWMLILGSLLMLLADKVSREDKVLNAKKGFFIGLYQALALIPGFSRSGATISGGLLLGLTRLEATKFSFMLALPILLGSGLKKLLDLYQMDALNTLGSSLFVGSIVAFVSGVIAIHFLIKFLSSHKLTIFIWYRVILAVVILFFL